MILELFPQAYTVCQVEKLPERLPKICFVAKTDKELSLVCPTESVPEETTVQEDGWRCFRIAGVLDFSLVGILAGLSGILAEARVGIFAVSTYDTDYILVKQTELGRAQEALEKRGYSFVTL